MNLLKSFKNMLLKIVKNLLGKLFELILQFIVNVKPHK